MVSVYEGVGERRRRRRRRGEECAVTMFIKWGRRVRRMEDKVDLLTVFLMLFYPCVVNVA